MPNETPKNRRPASLAVRVTLLVGVATTLVFLTFSWVVERSLELHFAEQDAGELRAVAAAVTSTLQQAQADAGLPQLQSQLAKAVSGHHNVFYSVAGADARVIYANGGPDLTRLTRGRAPAPTIDARQLTAWEEEGKTYQGAVLRLDRSAEPGGAIYTIAVAMDTDFHLSYLHGFKLAISWATVIVLCIALLVARLAVQWGHVPIRRVNEQIRTIGSSRLHVRLDAQAVPIELAGLVNAFNDMLERLENGFQRLSNFSDDIAHELRTPVTNLTIQTQVALGQPRSPDDYREILYSNLEEFDRMSRMIGDMLFLAQTENDLKPRTFLTVELSGMVQGLFDYFEAWAEERGVGMRLVGEAPGIQVDPDMMRRALSNLISNAIQHTERGHAITVSLEATAQRVLVRVENPGKKVPPENLSRLFDRFYRVDPSRQRNGQGAGLGLAIVKSIVELHGGHVSAASTDVGTRFDIALRRSAPMPVESKRSGK